MSYTLAPTIVRKLGSMYSFMIRQPVDLLNSVESVDQAEKLYDAHVASLMPKMAEPTPPAPVALATTDPKIPLASKPSKLRSPPAPRPAPALTSSPARKMPAASKSPMAAKPVVVKSSRKIPAAEPKLDDASSWPTLTNVP